MKELYLQNNLITAIDNLDFLSNLEILALNGNQIQRVEGIAHLSKLQVNQLTCLHTTCKRTLSELQAPQLSPDPGGHLSA